MTGHDQRHVEVNITLEYEPPRYVVHESLHQNKWRRIWERVEINNIIVLKYPAIIKINSILYTSMVANAENFICLWW